MSTYDDRDTAITRDPMQGPGYQQMPPQQYYSYPQYGRHFGGGYGMRGMGMNRGGGSGWSETKPFYLTSEFLGTLLCIAGVCITAAVSADLDSHGAALFSAILVAAYTVSRGIAKAGTRSRANDFRDDVNLGSRDGQQHDHQHQHVG
jgi:hypothetical protein